MSFLPVMFFVTSLFVFTLLRRLTPRRNGISVERDPVSVKIREGETVTIKLKGLEAYEKEFGKERLVPLWDGTFDNYKGYVIFFDSTTEKNRFSLGEYVISSSIWREQKLVRDEFFFDSNNVKIDLKGMGAKFLVVPASTLQIQVSKETQD